VSRGLTRGVVLFVQRARSASRHFPKSVLPFRGHGSKFRWFSSHSSIGQHTHLGDHLPVVGGTPQKSSCDLTSRQFTYLAQRAKVLQASATGAQGEPPKAAAQNMETEVGTELRALFSKQR
jgi:hypothetical protein